MQNSKFILFVICLIFLIPAISLAGKLYKWVDKSGVVHVTDNPETIPEEHRDEIKELGPENKVDKSLEKFKEAWKQTGSQKNLIGIGIAGVLIILIGYKILIYIKPKFQERKRTKRLRALELSGVDNMNAVEFTNYIGELFANRGFKVETPQGTFNLSVDLIAEKNKVKYAVQLKQQSSSVLKPVLNEIEREKHRYSCSRGMIITNDYFTEDATEFAKSKGTVLIDRDTLAEWIKDFEKKG